MNSEASWEINANLGRGTRTSVDARYPPLYLARDDR
jgi:hypothetical protein